jgi:hypothetical protein
MIHILIIAVCFGVMAYSHCCTDNPHNPVNEIAEEILEKEGFEDIEKCFHNPGDLSCEDKQKK